MSGGRTRRIADRTRVVIADMLEHRVKDARLGFVTVTDVRVSGDNQHATVFYTVLGDAAQRAESTAALNSAKGLLRSEVGRQLGLRRTPSLDFVLDGLPEASAHIEDLVARARGHDATVAEGASTASYAGDADPYRRPADDDGADA